MNSVPVLHAGNALANFSLDPSIDSFHAARVHSSLYGALSEYNKYKSIWRYTNGTLLAYCQLGLFELHQLI